MREADISRRFITFFGYSLTAAASSSPDPPHRSFARVERMPGYSGYVSYGRFVLLQDKSLFSTRSSCFYKQSRKIEELRKEFAQRNEFRSPAAGYRYRRNRWHRNLLPPCWSAPAWFRSRKLRSKRSGQGTNPTGNPRPNQSVSREQCASFSNQVLQQYLFIDRD